MGGTQGVFDARGGLRSYGAPVRLDKTYGNHWFIHGTNGSDAWSGKDRDHPFATLDRLFDDGEFLSGDTIHINGNISEHLISPVGRQDVTIIGECNNPRHADTHPGGGEDSGATWKSAGTNSPLLTLRNSAWRFINILFVAHASNYAVELQRNAIETAEGEYDASHAEFYNCRFASGAGGINDTGGCFNVRLHDNVFQALTTACILGVGNIGVGQSMWDIINNRFVGFTNGVKIAGFDCRIHGNQFTAGGTPDTTYVLNTNNGGGARNIVTDNFFLTETANFNTPDVVGTATDLWANRSIDSFSAGLESGYEVGQPA